MYWYQRCHLGGITLTESDDLSKYNQHIGCFRGEFRSNDFVIILRLIVRRASCKKTAISKSDIVPTALNLYFSTVADSDQSSNFMYPPCAICLWPVAMAPNLTPPQLQNHCYPSGWSQDDPYHSNLDPSSHSPWVRVGEVLLCWFTSALKTGKKNCPIK